jgi:hypothetical protein
MRRSVVKWFAAALVALVALPVVVHAKSGAPPCEPTLKDCPPEGCGGSFDPRLNQLKNATSNSTTPALRTLDWMKGLKDPEHFTKKGQKRDELTAMGCTRRKRRTITSFL